MNNRREGWMGNDKEEENMNTRGRRKKKQTEKGHLMKQKIKGKR
jgi:hypothetical protein